jgi:hypothetical protein
LEIYEYIISLNLIKDSTEPIMSNKNKHVRQKSKGMANNTQKRIEVRQVSIKKQTLSLARFGNYPELILTQQYALVRKVGGEVAAWADRLGVTVRSLQKAILSHKDQRKIPPIHLDRDLILLLIDYDKARVAFNKFGVSITNANTKFQAPTSVSIEALLGDVQHTANLRNGVASSSSSPMDLAKGGMQSNVTNTSIDVTENFTHVKVISAATALSSINSSSDSSNKGSSTKGSSSKRARTS